MQHRINLYRTQERSNSYMANVYLDCGTCEVAIFVDAEEFLSQSNEVDN